MRQRGTLARVTVLLLLFCCCCCCITTATATATTTSTATAETTTQELQTKRSYIVEFDTAPVVVAHHGRTLNRQARHVVDYVRYLRAQQDDTLAQVLQVKNDDNNDDDDDEIVVRYHYTFNGATVRLTETQADALRQQPGVVNLWPEGYQQLIPLLVEVGETTTTTTTIPLTHRGEAYEATGLTGHNIVMGIIDSGIVPESPSFAHVSTATNDLPNLEPYGTPPSTFVGTGCAFGNHNNPDGTSTTTDGDAAFECNNKILAAKCYVRSFSDRVRDRLPCGGDGDFLLHDDHFLSARDDAGHGTHVASTAAGNRGVVVAAAADNDNNDDDGNAETYISGVAHRARLSIHKACWDDKCGDTDTLAALEDAVADGVDIINYSIGGSSRTPAIEVAFFNVVSAGIIAVSSAGNNGPYPASVTWPAALPWMTAVAAAGDPYGAEMLLQISQPASLAGRTQFRPAAGGGVAVTPANFDTFDASSLVVANPLEACEALESSHDLTDKVALVRRGSCLFTDKFRNVAAAGAKAIVVYNDGAGWDRFGLVTMRVDADTTIPGIFVDHLTGNGLRRALWQDQDGPPPVWQLELVDTDHVVADFSSRGPNEFFSTGILKPDVMAPGTQILAAIAPLVAGVTEVDATGVNRYRYSQGTSMASPHVAGYMALLKQRHPDWSPARCKSALLTTAQHDGLVQEIVPVELPANPLDVGAGMARIQPALTPGLVYDTTMDDYLAVYCGFDADQVDRRDCQDLEKQGYSSEAVNLNAPSIAASGIRTSLTTTRTVTNVAPEGSAIRYTAVLDTPPGFDVTVSPCDFVLDMEQSLTFTVTITAADNLDTKDWLYGSLTWVGVEMDIPLEDPPRPQDGGSECNSATQGERTRFLRSGAWSGQGEGRRNIPGTPLPTSTSIPSDTPTEAPSNPPSTSITAIPSSALPTDSLAPSTSPSASATHVPSMAPSSQPTNNTQDSLAPSTSPSDSATHVPSMAPSSQPSNNTQDSLAPSTSPSDSATHGPSMAPSSQPSMDSSFSPSTNPTTTPTFASSAPPSTTPSSSPSSSLAHTSEETTDSATSYYTVYSPIVVSFQV